MKQVEFTLIACSFLFLYSKENKDGYIPHVLGFSTQPLLESSKPSFSIDHSRSSLLSLRITASSNETSSSINESSKKKGMLNRLLNLGRIKRSNEHLTKVNNMKNKPVDTTKSSVTSKANSGRIEVKTLSELDDIFNTPPSKKNKNWNNNDKILKSINVNGDTQRIGSVDHPDYVHPVLELLHSRRRHKKQQTVDKDDNFKVALSIEGGGMRGCVSAGMVTAIHYLGLEDCIDVVYGSSAGALIGAYFITRQLPWFGPEIYYDSLTTAGKKFIDTTRLLRAMGIGVLGPWLYKDVIFRSFGKPVLDLSYLLDRTMQKSKPLDWEKFVAMQKVQPLKVVTSGLKSEKSVVFDMENGGFSDITDLERCMHASMLLPGISGPVMNMECDANETNLCLAENRNIKDCQESFADALIYEPLPYRSAIAEGATHVIVLRTRADGTDVSGEPSVYEPLIFKRFFKRKNNFPNIYKRMRMQLHKKVYAEDIIKLNDAAGSEKNYKDVSSPHLMPIALPPGSEEISKLETGREAIFNGVRRGFARAYDALVEDPAERGNGMNVARYCFPDAILDYDPLDNSVDNMHESAFASYLKKKNIKGELLDMAKSHGKTASERGASQ